MKQTIISKLTSRKFWAAVVGFVGAILTALNVPASSSAQVTAIIMAGATVIGYMLAEGLVDASAAASSSLTPAYTGQIVGTVSDTAATPATAIGSAQAEQVQQVTSGLDETATAQTATADTASTAAQAPEK